MKRLHVWIEAMRLRTLPVSVAGVLCALGYANMSDDALWFPGWLCMLFAVLAQIASNFANEYYDYKAGLDKAGRVGPRRGVTEGDITPKSMKRATFGTLTLACIVGCLLIHWGGFWLVGVGIVIALGVLAYSTGPYPLSHHGLGEIAVMLFFGIIPVNLTYYLMCGEWRTDVLFASVSMGLMGANVLIVNNYRDVYDDMAVGKRTLCVRFGRRTMAVLYLVNGLLAVGLMTQSWISLGRYWLLLPLVFIVMIVLLTKAIVSRNGVRLNPMLGATAMLMLLYAIAFLMVTFITYVR